MTKRMMVLLAASVLALAAATPVVRGQEAAEETRPVLVVMDVQNVWMPHMAAEDRDAAIPKINEAIALFRELGYPVIRVYHSDPNRGPEPGTEPFAFPATVNIAEDDAMVVKSHPSAFTETDLDSLLREGRRNTVVLCGLSATGCVLATYFGAMDRGFTVLMVEGALLSGNASYTEVIEDICYAATVEDLRESLKAGSD